MPAPHTAYLPPGPAVGRPDADQARAVLVAHLVALSTGVPAEDVAVARHELLESWTGPVGALHRLAAEI